MRPFGISAEERFWRHVDKGGPVPAHQPHLGPCWLWTGSHDIDGYGGFCLDRERSRNVRAHRYAWETTVKPIPPGMLVLHSCDNPPCVNPAHLFVGTHGDNMADMVAKGRARSNTSE